MKIGVDICKISRFENCAEHFIERFLSNEEQKIFYSLNQDKKNTFLAGRWASKEAIYKATGDKEYLHYSILNDEIGKPFVQDHHEIKISISHDGDYAIAFVLIDD